MIKRAALVGASLAVVVATFAYFLPSIADYDDVWARRQAALVGVGRGAPRGDRAEPRTFAPPWMVSLPGLSSCGRCGSRKLRPRSRSSFPAGLRSEPPAAYGILRAAGVSRPQRRRAGGHADEPLEPVPQSPVPDCRRVPAHDHRRADRGACDCRVHRRRGARNRRRGLRARSSSATGLRTTSATSLRASRTGRSARSAAAPFRGTARASSDSAQTPATSSNAAGSAHALVARRQPERLPRPARLAARARRPGVGGHLRRGVRRVGARPHHRDDPDHAGWDRYRRARIDEHA